MLRGNFFWTPPEHANRMLGLMLVAFVCILVGTLLRRGWLFDGVMGIGALATLAMGAYSLWLSSRYF